MTVYNIFSYTYYDRGSFHLIGRMDYDGNPASMIDFEAIYNGLKADDNPNNLPDFAFMTTQDIDEMREEEVDRMGDSPVSDYTDYDSFPVVSIGTKDQLNLVVRQMVADHYEITIKNMKPSPKIAPKPFGNTGLYPGDKVDRLMIFTNQNRTKRVSLVRKNYTLPENAVKIDTEENENYNRFEFNSRTRASIVYRYVDTSNRHMRKIDAKDVEFTKIPLSFRVGDYRVVGTHPEFPKLDFPGRTKDDVMTLMSLYAASVSLND